MAAARVSGVPAWGRSSLSALILAQVQKLHRRRSGRLGTAGADWNDFRWLPEIPISASGWRITKTL